MCSTRSFLWRSSTTGSGITGYAISCANSRRTRSPILRYRWRSPCGIRSPPSSRSGTCASTGSGRKRTSASRLSSHLREAMARSKRRSSRESMRSPTGVKNRPWPHSVRWNACRERRPLRCSTKRSRASSTWTSTRPRCSSPASAQSPSQPHTSARRRCTRTSSLSSEMPRRPPPAKRRRQSTRRPR